jgi:hypothetical protein
MHPFPNPMLMAGGRVIRIGYTSAAGLSGGAITFPAGTAPGDLAIVFGSNTGASFSAWAVDTYNSLRTHTKVLDASDIASPPGSLNGTYLVVIYRGAKVATRRTQASYSGTTTMTQAGFTKSGGRGFITAFLNNLGGNGNVSAPFTEIVDNIDSGGAGMGFGELLSPSLYTNGTAVVWSGMSGNTNMQCVTMELT